MSGIEAKNLVKDFGHFRAVDGVSLVVPLGEVLGFLGPNGAGKSTMMKMLTGFIAPTSGAAFICGRGLADDPVAAKQLFGYMPERGPLYNEMTVEEFLRFVGRARGLGRPQLRSAVERVLDLCAIAEMRRRLLGTLSKGYRQRVGLAQALLHDPPCLILDEPTDGLDPNQKDDVRSLICSMRTSKAIILSTHILDEVEATCTRVMIINRGRILLDETPDEMRQRGSSMDAVFRDMTRLSSKH